MNCRFSCQGGENNSHSRVWVPTVNGIMFIKNKFLHKWKVGLYSVSEGVKTGTIFTVFRKVIFLV